MNLNIVKWRTAEKVLLFAAEHDRVTEDLF